MLDHSTANARDALARIAKKVSRRSWRLLAARRLVTESPLHLVVADSFA
jgi:hypothetical protein